MNPQRNAVLSLLLGGACCSVAAAQCQLDKLPLPDPVYNGWGIHAAGDANLYAVASNSQDNAPGMAVYALRRVGTTLVSEGRLLPSPIPNPNITRFGQALAVSGDRILVGDYQFAPNNTGRIYLFEHIDGVWTQTFTRPGVTQSLEFGFAVALDGSVMAISTPTRGSYRGIVEIYRHNAADWTLAQTINNPAPSSNELHFGHELYLRDGRLMIGAPNEDDGRDSRAYIYQDGPSGFELAGTLAPQGFSHSTAGREFGTAIHFDGDLAIVGAQGENSFRGAAYVYRRDAISGWVFAQRLTGPIISGFPEFGCSVAVISGQGLAPDTIVVGSEGDTRAANTAGAVIIFSGDAGEYGVAADVFAADASEGARFGSSLVISGETFLVGARSDTTNSAPPPNGMDGSAYLFAGLLPGCTPGISDLCAIKAGAPDANGNDIPDGCETEPCLADFNGDGFRNPDDLADFITCFFLDVQFPGFCPRADFNHDTSRDPDDLADFITTFFTSTC